MILPIGEGTKRHSFPIFNVLLLVANVAVFWHQATAPETANLVATYALVPEYWSFKTLLTSMYLHGGLWHLVGNMMFLMIAGNSVEDRMGHLPYLVFYHVAGMAGGLAHVAVSNGAAALVPCVGASGAISGVMAAYLVFFPTAPIKYVVLPFMRTFESPCWYSVGLWVLAQFLLWKQSISGKATEVAVMAHIGGFAFGLVAALLLRLFGRNPDVKK